MDWLEWEDQTVRRMIGLWCRHTHADRIRPGGHRSLCADCAELADYASHKLEKCRYGASKPVCSTCTTHCYKPDRREEIRRVMRYAGPRMLFRYPVRAVIYLIRKKAMGQVGAR